MVTGLMAPARVNGVIETAWPARAISIRPSDMGPSMRRGELVLIMVRMPGSRASWSRSTPRAMHAISMPSAERSRPKA